MNVDAESLRAWERLAFDARWLGSLIERTMLTDAEALGYHNIMDELRQVQRALDRVHGSSEKMLHLLTDTEFRP